MNRKLEHLLYISLPDRLGRDIGSFTVDPSILLPVEAPEQANEEWDFSSISWEMIVSGMLKVLAWNADHEHAGYYRNFIQAVQPDIVSDLTRTAITKCDTMDYDFSEELFRAAAEIEQTDEKTILNLALLYEQQMDLYLRQDNRKLTDLALEGGYRTYMEALRRHPDSANVRYNAAYFFLKIHNPVKAREHLTAFLHLVDENDKRVLRVRKVLESLDSEERKGQLFTEAYDAIRMNREEEGVALVRTLLEDHPESWESWFLLGWGLRRLERYEDAKLALEEALRKDDSKVDTCNELAICLMELKNFDQCRNMLQKALELEPDNIKIMSNLAILHMKMNRPDLAAGEMKKVLEINPEDPVAAAFFREQEKF